MDGSAAVRAEGWQHRAQASIACFWLLAASQAVLSALHSDWPIGFGVVLMFAVPGSGMLLRLTESPVRHG
jgi:hypothetical protein